MPFGELGEHDLSIRLHTPCQVIRLPGGIYTNYFYNLYHLLIVNARFFSSYRRGEVPGKHP